MISIEVKDFGPIIEGKVDLKPLTIFVGPNNSGKSYMAMLMYSLFRSIPYDDRIKRLIPHEQVEHDNPHFSVWMRENYPQLERSRMLTLDDLPDDIKGVFQWANQEWGDEFATPFEQELGQSFASDLGNLVRSGAGHSFEVTLSQDNPLWSLWLSLESNGKILSKENPEVAILPKSKGNEPEIGFLLDKDDPAQALYSLFNNFPNSVHYLPPGRASLISTYKLIASASVRRLSQRGEDSRISPKLTGIVSGFISDLVTLNPDYNTRVYSIGRWLEEEISGGAINLSKESENPEIFYRQDGTDYRLHRTSSMVSELAPLILYLKHKIEPGDILFIDEPESHLHPANQRKLARGIVKLIRMGVKLVMTTHSDYFLSQLSNFIRLGDLPRQEQAKYGYDENDYLKSDEVGCYLFDYDEEKGGITTGPLEVTPEDGIDEESFSKVAESLYNEFVDLHRARIE